jgi:hypothetical protein
MRHWTGSRRSVSPPRVGGCWTARSAACSAVTRAGALALAGSREMRERLWAGVDLSDVLPHKGQDLESAAASEAMWFRGVWFAPNLYHFGAVVLRDDQPWYCNAHEGTTARPARRTRGPCWRSSMRPRPAHAGSPGSRGVGVTR